MIMLDAIILESLMTKSLKAKLEFGNTVPLVKDIYSQTQDDVNGFFDPRNIPYIPYSSVTSAKIFSDQIDKITLWLGSTNAALKYVLADHEALAKRYMVICERINNEMTVFKEDMSSIMNYSCHNIFSLSSKQRPESNIGRIGNFITLPYFLESCKMFNGSLFLRGASTGTILFSNIENVSSIPMSNLPSAATDASSIIACSEAPGGNGCGNWLARRGSTSSGVFGMCGGAPSSVDFRPSACSRRCAGSIVSTSTRRPAMAACSASAADVVVLPTPPEPHATISLALRSTSAIGRWETGCGVFTRPPCASPARGRRSPAGSARAQSARAG